MSPALCSDESATCVTSSDIAQTLDTGPVSNMLAGFFLYTVTFMFLKRILLYRHAYG